MEREQYLIRVIDTETKEEKVHSVNATEEEIKKYLATVATKMINEWSEKSWVTVNETYVRDLEISIDMDYFYIIIAAEKLPTKELEIDEECVKRFFKNDKRIETVMEALNLDKYEADRVVKHLARHDCLDWIDAYSVSKANDEPLVDVHYESTFADMIDWQFEGYSPSQMLNKSSSIEDYPEMLALNHKVIFWYGLV